MALCLSCLYWSWSEKHETEEDWHWLAWMYNCKHGELHRMPQVPSPVSWHDMTVMWHDHAVMVTSHHTSTLAARSGSWYMIVCIKPTKVPDDLHETVKLMLIPTCGKQDSQYTSSSKVLPFYLGKWGPFTCSLYIVTFQVIAPHLPRQV